MAIGVIRYGAGNATSVCDAFDVIGVETRSVAAPDEMDDLDGFVLPGVGAFAHTMSRLHETGLGDAIRGEAERPGGRPLLGICVGMQVLATSGREFGEHDGLGLVPGTIDPLLPDAGRVPHMGWNEIEITADDALFEGLSPRPAFYFAHSYVFTPGRGAVVSASFEHGLRYPAAVRRGRQYGVQFHPEKSQRDGLRLLANFERICRDGGEP